MSLTSGSTLLWSDIKSLFNRINAERNRFLLETIDDTNNPGVVKATTVNDLKQFVQEMTSVGYLQSIASTSSVPSTSTGTTLTPSSLNKLSAVLSNIESAKEVVATNGSFIPFEASNGTFFATGGAGFNGFNDNFGSGDNGFDSSGGVGFSGFYVSGGRDSCTFQTESCRGYSTAGDRTGTPINSGFNSDHTTCGTFSFTSCSSARNNPFCASGTFFNGCPFGGTADFSGFLVGGAYNSCAAAASFFSSYTFNSVYNNAVTVQGSFEFSFGTGGSFEFAFKDTGTFNKAFRDECKANFDAQFTYKCVSNFNSTFNKTGHCGSFNGSGFFGSL